MQSTREEKNPQPKTKDPRAKEETNHLIIGGVNSEVRERKKWVSPGLRWAGMNLGKEHSLKCRRGVKGRTQNTLRGREQVEGGENTSHTQAGHTYRCTVKSQRKPEKTPQAFAYNQKKGGGRDLSPDTRMTSWVAPSPGISSSREHQHGREGAP